MNKLADILKTASDFAQFALFAKKPDNAFWNLGKTKEVKAKGNKLSQIAQPSPTPSPSPMPTPIPNDYEKLTMPTFDKYGIPREIAYGIRQAEGGSPNSFNMGATDSNPTGGFDYGSVLGEATAAAKLLNGTFEKDFIGSGRYNDKFKPAFQTYKKTGDIRNFLKGIADSGYAGPVGESLDDPEGWKIRSINQAHAAGTTGAGEIYDRWDDFVADTAPYKKWHGKY